MATGIPLTSMNSVGLPKLLRDAVFIGRMFVKDVRIEVYLASHEIAEGRDEGKS